MLLQRFHMNRSKRKDIATDGFAPISAGVNYGFRDKVGVSHVAISLEGIDNEKERYQIVMTPEEAIKYGDRIAALGRDYLEKDKLRKGAIGAEVMKIINEAEALSK